MSGGARSGFTLRTRLASGVEAEHRASHVIFAIGDMHRPRILGIPGENLPHVSHYLGDPHRYFGRRVLIVGGKNSAVEAAIRLYRVGADVTISYRGSEFDEKRIKYWLLPEVKGLIKAGKIGFKPRTVVRDISQFVVFLADVGREEVRSHDAIGLQADDVLLLTGYEMDGSLLASAGVELAGPQNAPAFDPQTMQTNVPGIYVAGTATAGTQHRVRVFIENCHEHGARIAAHICGKPAPAATPDLAGQAPES